MCIKLEPITARAAATGSSIKGSQNKMRLPQSSNQRNSTQEDFYILQIRGKAFTRAIEQAEAKGDSEQAERLLLQKSELIKKLRAYIHVN